MVLTVGGGRDRPSDRSHEASAAVPSDEDMVSPHASDFGGGEDHGQQSRDGMQRMLVAGGRVRYRLQAVCRRVPARGRCQAVGGLLEGCWRAAGRSAQRQ